MWTNFSRFRVPLFNLKFSGEIVFPKKILVVVVCIKDTLCRPSSHVKHSHRLATNFIGCEFLLHILFALAFCGRQAGVKFTWASSLTMCCLYLSSQSCKLLDPQVKTLGDIILYQIQRVSAKLFDQGILRERKCLPI